jgi:hypothetical protein
MNAVRPETRRLVNLFKAFDQKMKLVRKNGVAGEKLKVRWLKGASSFVQPRCFTGPNPQALNSEPLTFNP